MTSTPNIVAVIPAYNEGKTLRHVVEGLLPYVSSVVVADDNSQDNTVSEAQSAGAVVVRHAVNGGYDKNINDGFAEAARLGADIIFTFDADGEHASEDVLRMLAPLLSGEADIVLGQRPHTTHVAEKLFALYTGARYGIRDPLCGFKAYRRSVYDTVGQFDTVQSIGTELMLRGLKKGFKLALVPIELRSRVEDSSRFYKRRFRANMKILRAMWRVLAV
jgi:glycosyltransferase involved in cell wall biosynthesis